MSETPAFVIVVFRSIAFYLLPDPTRFAYFRKQTGPNRLKRVDFSGLDLHVEINSGFWSYTSLCIE